MLGEDGGDRGAGADGGVAEPQVVSGAAR
jgi:hypothetical protein